MTNRQQFELGKDVVRRQQRNVTLTNAEMPEAALREMRQQGQETLPDVQNIEIQKLDAQNWRSIAEFVRRAVNLRQLTLRMNSPAVNPSQEMSAQTFLKFVQQADSGAKLDKLIVMLHQERIQDYCPGVAALIEKQPDLRELSLSGMRANKFQPVADAIAQHVHGLRDFRCTELLGGAAMGHALARVISAQHDLHTLRLKSCYPGQEEGAAALFEAIGGQKGLQHLALEEVPCGAESGALLQKALKNTTQLRLFSAQHIGLDKAGLRILTGLLKQNPHLTYIGMEEGALDHEETVQFIRQVVIGSRHIRQFVLNPAREALSEAVRLYGGQCRSKALLVGSASLSPQSTLMRRVEENQAAQEKFISYMKYEKLVSHPEYDAIVGKNDWRSLQPYELFFIDQRRHLLHDKREKMRVTPEEYEAFIASLPGLPPAGEGFAEALFTCAEGARMAPIDHPRLVEDKAALARILSTGGFTQRMLMDSTPTGLPLLHRMVEEYDTATLVGTLNSHGRKLRGDILLEPAQEGRRPVPVMLFRRMIDHGDAYALFTRDNWAGGDTADLRRCFACLPPEQQERVNMHSLLAVTGKVRPVSSERWR